MVKIQRNDPCPCGSGKKYKFCCGETSSPGTKICKKKEYKRYEMQQADYVINHIDRDWLFLCNALQIIIGQSGYQFCKMYQAELSGEWDKSLIFLTSAVKKDMLGVYSTTKENFSDEHLWDTLPYGGELADYSADISNAVEDFPSLAKRGVIYKSQITLFHLYILDNIVNRFDDYFYAPSDTWLKGQYYGIFAHRGYDYLIGISLYIELQLGVHLFDFGFIYSKQKKESLIKSYFGDLLDPHCVTDNMCVFLESYVESVKKATKDLSLLDELIFYKKIGAFNDKDYLAREKIITSSKKLQKCSYQEYLIFLIGAICFNTADLFCSARLAFPQCDFIKMISGIESIYDLFESQQELTSCKDTTTENTDYNPYHEALFLMLDELYGNSVGVKEINKLKYRDPEELVFDETSLFTDPKNGDNYALNPGAKSITTNKFRVRRLRMELYNLLSGKTVPLIMSPNPENIEMTNICVVAGNYLMIPWLSNGNERTVHSKPFDGSSHSIRELYSDNIQDRKAYLTMEYRLSEIPVNCIEEYLNPPIYYNWLRIKEQNNELKKINTNLKKQMKMNRDFVRNIAHSAVNYLNSERLANTGIQLHSAEIGNPSLEKLHEDGLLLMLQSEQEKYLTRQLKDVVRKYQSEGSEAERQAKEASLENRIRGSISRTDGLNIEEVLEFALKTVLARILFRKNDEKGKYIQRKLKKTELEWTNITSSFMTDVLATDNAHAAFKWWNNNITNLEIHISDNWRKIKFLRDGGFYDLVTEVVLEMMLNALVHGQLENGIKLEFGQVLNEKKRPIWAYIQSENSIEEACAIGAGIGLSSLNNEILLLNRESRAIEHGKTGSSYKTTVWLDKKLLMAK